MLKTLHYTTSISPTLASLEKLTSEPQCESVAEDEAWPPMPTQMGQHDIVLFINIATDTACIFAAIPFLVLAGYVARVDGKVDPEKEWNMIYVEVRPGQAKTYGFTRDMFPHQAHRQHER